MRKTTLLKSLFLLAVLFAGTNSALADDTPKVTLDFSTGTWGFPTSSGTGITSETSYTDTGTGYTITVNPSTKAYLSSSTYLLWGKTNSTLTLPKFDFAVSKIVLGSGPSNASTGVKQNIYVGETAVSTETTGATQDNVFEINESYQAAGTQFVIKISSNHNSQISKIEIYEAATVSSIPTPELSVATGSEVELGSKVTITNTSDDYVYFYTLDGTTPAYDSTGDPTGTTQLYSDGITINGDVTVKVLATDYDEDSNVATYEYTYKRGTAVTPVGPAGSEGKFVKVTSTDDIEDGDYLIVYEDGKVAFNGALETLDAANNSIEVNFESDGSITETTTNKAAIFTIDVTNGTLKAANGQYIGVTTNSNGLKTSTTSTAYSNTFSIDDSGNADIYANFSGSTMYLVYNSDSQQKRFRYYKSSQKAIQLYKYVPGTPVNTFDITIGSAGYKTLVSSVDFETPEGVTAYIVTASSASSATLTSVDQVPAGEPVILKGSGTVTLSVVDDAAAISGNLLQVSTESTGNGVYVLANTNGVGFYLWKGGSLGAGRVYLPAPAGAREFIGFGDEATGIGASLNDKGQMTNDKVYNLNGQRVAQPVKGLYIVNGKKIIIK